MKTFGLQKINYYSFFDNVEPLQIGLDYWYITTDGPAVAMILESKYVSNHVYTTTSVNATGLIVNSLIYKQHEVNFLLDYTRTRTVGTLVRKRRRSLVKIKTLDFHFSDF